MACPATGTCIVFISCDYLPVIATIIVMSVMSFVVAPAPPFAVPLGCRLVCHHHGASVLKAGTGPGVASRVVGSCFAMRPDRVTNVYLVEVGMVREQTSGQCEANMP